MILQITNLAEYNQDITLHTGEAKTVVAGQALRINTGTDKRLAGFYASLINYDFDVKVLEASGQEVNNFEDAINRLTAIKEAAQRNKIFQEKKVYPEDKPAPYTPALVSDIEDPVTIDQKPVTNQPIARKASPQVENVIPRTQVPQQVDGPVVIVDSKLGTIIEDMTPVLPDDYPDDPNAAAEVARYERQEEQAKKAQDDSDNKWYKLDELDEETLKTLLNQEFGETTRLKNKSKIIYHIIDLADADEINVYELVDKYLGK